MSTYSSNLRLTLIGDGDQAGTWGQTTNTNLGTLLEQAITGVVDITMLDANYTLSNLNGVSDKARNAVLVVGGTNTGVKDVIAPAVEKLYVVKNATVGGFAIRIKTAGGAAFCERLFGGTWKQTSYNGNIRKNYAGIGYIYRADIDAFVPPQPFPSWVLNSVTAQWQAPTPMPQDGKRYSWDEATISWKEITEGV